jgi:hypothetical protein
MAQMLSNGEDSTQYQHYLEVTMHSPVAVTLTDFPAIIGGRMESFDTAYLIANYGMKNDCSDVLLVSGNQVLHTEIEKGTCNTNNTVLWVRYPSLTDGSAVRIYFGNASKNNVVSDALVWENQYLAVYHLADEKDSTNRYNLSITGTPATVADCVLGRCMIFNGGTILYNNNFLFPKYNYSSYARVRPLNNGGWGVYSVDSVVYPNNCYKYLAVGTWQHNFESVVLGLNGWVGQGRYADFQVDTSQWYALNEIEDATANTLKLYVDGLQNDNSPGIGEPVGDNTRSTDISTHVSVGGIYWIHNAGQPSYMILDELRISNTTRSEEWIIAEDQQYATIGNVHDNINDNTRSSDSSGVSITDTFGGGANCTGDNFSCGTTNDGIINTGGTIIVNPIVNDGTTTALCAVNITGNTGTIKTCIFRQGQSTTACDNSTDVRNGNHSNYYTCPNGLSCGWNGQNSIPFFMTTPFTNTVSRQNIIFIAYTCAGSNINAFQYNNQYLHVIDTKGITCSGNSVMSIGYDGMGSFNLGGYSSCSKKSYCDETATRNYTLSVAMNDNYCVPGCYDGFKNADETQNDYGGKVCGNCTPGSKANDELYPIARQLQEDNSTYLSAENPFNATLYCQQSANVAGAGAGAFMLILFIAIVTITLLVGAIVVLFMTPIVPALLEWYARRKAQQKIEDFLKKKP